ncbi:MAG: hypothetical protein OCC45_10940 [Desulfotalea sp.]
MTLKKKSGDQLKTSSVEIEKLSEIHEPLRLKKYFATLKSDNLIGDLVENVKSNDEVFSEFKNLIKTAKYRNHDS